MTSTKKSLHSASKAFGAKRLKTAQHCKSRGDWERLWKKSAHPFVFKPGDCWTHCSEYAVKDFAAEVGFWIDVLGFSVNAFGADYAMFCPENKSYFFSVVPAVGKRKATKLDALRLSFMLDGIKEVGKKLIKRGIQFDEALAPYGSPNSPMYRGLFRTPAGIQVELWGMVKK